MFLLCLGYVSAAVTYSSQAFVGTSVTGDAEDTGNFIQTGGTVNIYLYG